MKAHSVDGSKEISVKLTAVGAPEPERALFPGPAMTAPTFRRLWADHCINR